jgi:tetratricopeptide (TPR) repeat protein
MSLQQRLHVVYVLAMAYSAAEFFDPAVGCLDEALELALRLGDGGARPDLLYLRGSILRRRWCYREAAANFASCLQELGARDGDQAAIAVSSTTLRLEVLLILAGIEFLLGSHDNCRNHLSDAAHSLSDGNQQPGADGTLHWITALEERLRGHLEHALAHATAACEIYSALDLPTSTGRIQVVVAEIIMDITDCVPQGSYLDRHIEEARAHINKALSETQSVADRSGVGLAVLARTRLSRLCRPSGDDASSRVSSIESVIGTAKELRDSALLCQAYTVLADELSARHETQASANLYRQAIRVAEMGDVIALATSARRALLQREEMCE